MQSIVKRIWQAVKGFFEQLFGLQRQESKRMTAGTQEASAVLSDTDYEFLFTQLLEGVARGWHEGRILKFFQQLGDRGKQRLWVAWLERFGQRVLASPAPNQQLAVRMIRLGELAQSFGPIQQIGASSYRIGRQLLTRDREATIWEYAGPDLQDTAPASVPEADGSQNPEGQVATMTLEELSARLQQDSVLAEQIAQQLGIETTDPQTILETLVGQFQAVRGEVANQPTPDTVEDWFHLGLQQANQGDLAGAVASWDKALELNPYFSPAWHNRGSALGNLGDLEGATASFEKAIEINNDDYQAWNAKGNGLYGLKRWQEALDCWEKVLQLQPNYAPAWFNRGCGMENLGNLEEAIASHQKALEIQPDFELAQTRLNKLLEIQSSQLENAPVSNEAPAMESLEDDSQA